MKYVCVIGGANIDIFVSPYSQLVLRDSNPSRIHYAYGGVARNIAENLTRLQVNTHFVTAFGQDNFADLLKQDCLRLGMDISSSSTFNGNTSTYICVNDISKDMFLGASDMDILSNISVDLLSSLLTLFNNATAIVIDTNLNVEVLDYLISNVTQPIFIETVSCAKAKKLISRRLPFSIKANSYEAEVITGVSITDQTSCHEALLKLNKQGAVLPIITCGKEGSYYYYNGKFGHNQGISVISGNTTGAGDSFLAGVVWGYQQGKDVDYCLRAGSLASILTLQSDKPVSELLSSDYLTTLLK
ncbi:MAG: carbohydrate kinase family protein [Clostridia bacterium]